MNIEIYPRQRNEDKQDESIHSGTQPAKECS